MPVFREAGGLRLRRLSASTALASVIHVGFTALFLVLWKTMVFDVAAPEPPTAEFIVLPQGETKPAVAPAPPPAPVPQAAPSPTPIATPTPPSPPAQQPAASDPAPPDPPAPSALDEALKPGLLEPPPEAKAAATQSTTNQAGNASTADSKSTEGAAGTPSATATPEPAKPAAVPTVLTTGESPMTVPAPSPGDDSPPVPPAAGDPTQAQKTATQQLAAALPFSSMPMPQSFRAALSAQGTSNTAAYRGSVFGALERAREGASAQAQARQLKGQVVLAIVLTATGAIDKVSVVQSSGSAAADAFAIDMVRRAAPFPPPPPGASRTFTPAIAFGNG